MSGRTEASTNQAPTQAPTAPTPMPKAALCPYCGHLSMNTQRCERCRGFFDPLSRQASQNSMGPWFIRDEAQPFRPGCSYETLCGLIRRGKVGRDTVLRGPTTRQFWTWARNAPGVAHLLGECHACHEPAATDDVHCRACGASFAEDMDRQFLGLAPVHLLPGHTAPEVIAASSLSPLIGGAGAAGIRPESAARVSASGAYPQAQVHVPTPALDRIRGMSTRQHPDRRGTALMVLAIVSTVLALLLAGVLFGPAVGIHLPALQRATLQQRPATMSPAAEVPKPPPMLDQRPEAAAPAPSESAPAPASGDPVDEPAEQPASDALGSNDPNASAPESDTEHRVLSALRMISSANDDASLGLAEAALADLAAMDASSATQVEQLHALLAARRQQLRLAGSL